MKHLGDITKISGHTAPVVDCIIGGSPCQDLSVAGKRAGLDGERSGLYMEQIRIVKEMREHDERNGRSGVDIRPRYMVWENVPGAFSSNKGEDFRIVLEELAKIKDKDAVIPMPDKWTNQGCIMGDGWSIAWRVFDAQFWGVPQRRRRIALVADFGGESAPEILFVRKSVSRDIEPSQPKRKEAPSDASRSLGADDSIGVDLYNHTITGDKTSTLGVNCGMSHGRQHIITLPYTLKLRSGVSVDSKGKAAGKGALIQTDLSATLGVSQDQYLFQPVFSVENHPNDSRVGINEDGKVQALTGRMGTGGGNVQMVMQCYSKSNRAQSATDNETWVESETANTLNAFDVGDVRTTEAVVMEAYQHHGYRESDVLGTLTAGQNGCVRGDTPLVCYQAYPEVGDVRTTECVVALDRECFAQQALGEYKNSEVASSLKARDYKDHTDLVCCSVAKAYPEVADGVVGTLDAHSSNFPGMRGGMERTMVVAVDCRNATEDVVNGSLQSNSAHSLNGNNVIRTRYIVRRLTPLECERLQGFPDNYTNIGEWTDSNGKKRQTSDASRYKALGNSISLPNWKWVLKRLCACYERDATMASLFDGIGGFGFLWEQLNGKGSCLWASEIEEFCIAVTKKRIGD